MHAGSVLCFRCLCLHELIMGLHTCTAVSLSARGNLQSYLWRWQFRRRIAPASACRCRCKRSHYSQHTAYQAQGPTACGQTASCLPFACMDPRPVATSNRNRLGRRAGRSCSRYWAASFETGRRCDAKRGVGVYLASTWRATCISSCEIRLRGWEEWQIEDCHAENGRWEYHRGIR